MKVIKIKMRVGCTYSSDVEEIDQLYIVDCNNPGYFKKEIVHNYLIDYPGTIQVGIYPYPDVVPAVSANGEKYVKSTPDCTAKDNLLNLPRD